MHSPTRFGVLVMVALVVHPTLAPQASAAEAGWSVDLVSADGRDGDGFLITLRAGADAPSGGRDVVLHVNHTAPDGVADAWREDAGVVEVAPGALLEVRVDPTRGPGTYVVNAHVAGARPVRDVVLFEQGGEAEANLSGDVPDEPPLLAYSSDGVNAPGKTKVPGDALIARVRVTDENGLDDVTTLEFLHSRLLANGSHVPVSRTVLTGLDEGNASVTTRLIEHRFAHAPLPAGDYVESVTARSRAGDVVGVDRAFRVADVKPTGLDATPLAPPAVTPDDPHVLTGAVLLGDRNFGTGPLDPSSVAAFGIVTARLYRGSAVAADAGWAVALGDADAPRLDLTLLGHREAGDAYRVVDAYGSLHVPVTVHVPRGAVAGDYRVSLYHAPDGLSAPALVGSLTFVVRDLPRVTSVVLTPTAVAPGSRVEVRYALDGEPAERVDVRLLRERAGAWVQVGEKVVAPPGNGTASLPVPRDLPPGSYRVEVAPALEPDRPALTEQGRRTALRLEAGPPFLHLRPAGAAARLSAGPLGGVIPVMLDAHNFSLEDAALTWLVTDARGVTAPADGRATREGPGAFAFDASGLAPGRYRLRVDAETATGASAAEVVLDVGAWLALRAPTSSPLTFGADGRMVADVPVSSEGNSPVRALVVAVGRVGGAVARGEVTLIDASGAHRANGLLDDGVARVEGSLLAPSESGATLRIVLARPGGLDAGPLEVPIRVHVGRSVGAS